MATPPDVDPLNREFSYAQASPALHEQARRGAVEGLTERFPHVSAVQWWQAYHHCQPDIWVMKGEVMMAGDDILKLIAWITLIHGPAVNEVQVYKAASLYLSGKLRLARSQSRRVLAAHPGEHTPLAAEALQLLLQELQQEDLIATYFQYPHYLVASEQTSTGPPPSTASPADALPLAEQEAALVADQWRALREWLAQQSHMLRSWDAEAFQRYLGWPETLLERLLFALDINGEDPAQHPSVYTLERLVQVQVLLLNHHFSLP